VAHGSILDSHVTTTIVEAQSPFAVRPSDNLIAVNAVDGNIVLRTPTATGKRDKRYRFVKTDASANTVTIENLHGQTYSGAGSIVLTAQWQSVEIHCDGANWIIIAAGAGITVSPTYGGFGAMQGETDPIDATVAAVSLAAFTAPGDLILSRLVFKCLDADTVDVGDPPTISIGTDAVDGDVLAELIIPLSAVDGIFTVFLSGAGVIYPSGQEFNVEVKHAGAATTLSVSVQFHGEIQP
jgi:hypothetical protein